MATTPDEAAVAVHSWRTVDGDGRPDLLWGPARRDQEQQTVLGLPSLPCWQVSYQQSPR